MAKSWIVSINSVPVEENMILNYGQLIIIYDNEKGLLQEVSFLINKKD